MKVTNKQYGEALYEAVKNISNNHDLDRYIMRFVKIVKDDGNLKHLSQIMHCFIQKYNNDNNIIEATVTTAFEMEQKQKKHIESFIQKEYNAHSIIVKYQENLSIIGGVVIQVNDEIIDFSAKKRLHTIKETLLKY